MLLLTVQYFHEYFSLGSQVFTIRYMYRNMCVICIAMMYWAEELKVRGISKGDETCGLMKQLTITHDIAVLQQLVIRGLVYTHSSSQFKVTRLGTILISFLLSFVLLIRTQDSKIVKQAVLYTAYSTALVYHFMLTASIDQSNQYLQIILFPQISVSLYMS